MRRRYYFIPDAAAPTGVRASEVPPDHGTEPRARVEIMTDSHYEGLRTMDGVDVSTRRRHREHMRRNGLALADDFKETWAKSQATRDAYFRDGPGDSKQLHEAVERAFARGGRR